MSCEHDMANGTCSICDPYVVQNLRDAHEQAITKLCAENGALVGRMLDALTGRCAGTIPMTVIACGEGDNYCSAACRLRAALLAISKLEASGAALVEYMGLLEKARVLAKGALHPPPVFPGDYPGWVMCTEHKIIIETGGYCPRCHGDRHLILVVPSQSRSSAKP